MSLANKYRPRTVDEIYGQDNVKALLNNLDKVKSHLFLFHSRVPGVTKTTSARILASTLNCLSENKPCGTCNNCKLIFEEKTADIEELNFASERGIDDARELQNRSRLTPFDLNKRIFILDEFHQATTPAQNSLLKIFEEAPSHSYFIICTTDISKIIPTIQSRSTVVELLPGSVENIVKTLSNICDKEDIKYEDSGLTAIAESCNGSYRNAIMTLENCRSHGLIINDKLVNKVVGVSDKALIKSVIDAFLNKSLPDLVKFLNVCLTTHVNIKDLCKEATETCLIYAESTKLKIYTDLLNVFAEAQLQANDTLVYSVLVKAVQVPRAIPPQSYIDNISNLCKKLGCMVEFTEHNYAILDFNKGIQIAVVKNEEQQIYGLVKWKMLMSNIPKIIENKNPVTFIQLQNNNLITQNKNITL
jgi:DNA polymerase III subunit gamma/tau